MTETTLKRKGGRPPLPPHQPVVDSASCRNAISRELMGQGRVRQLAALHKLHKAYLAGEEAEREDARVKANESLACTKAQTLKIRRAEYLRRFAATPLGAKALLRQIETLKEQVRTLEAELTAKESVQVTAAMMPTLTERTVTIE